MERREAVIRKVRSDKKRAIAPYLPDHYRVWIHRIARRCDIPEGEVGLQLLKICLQSEACIQFFSAYFKRDFRFTENITYCGHKDALPISDYLQSAATEERSRYKLKASQSLYDALCEFQIALGVNYLAHATHALLEYALNDLATLQRLVPGITKADYTGPVRPVALTASSGSAWSILK